MKLSIKFIPLDVTCNFIFHNINVTMKIKIRAPNDCELD
jgi:hypothetical protein